MTGNLLRPEVIVTDRVLDPGADSPGRLRELPAGRQGTVKEPSSVATFLCSGPAAPITGTMLLIDGRTTKRV